MFLVVLLALVSCGAGSGEDRADDPRCLLQALTLCLPGTGDTFAVVYPETLLVLDDPSRNAVAAIAQKLSGCAGAAGWDAGPVLDALLKRNKRSHDLPIDGVAGGNFRVDREGAYTGYLASGNEGDWKRMYADHPEVTSIVHAGLPAYDREAGFVLVYIQSMIQSAAGNGSIHVFRSAGGALEHRGRVVVWSP